MSKSARKLQKKQKKPTPEQARIAQQLAQIRDGMTEEQAKECHNMAYEVASKAIFQAISDALAAHNDHEQARSILQNQHIVAIQIPIEYSCDSQTYRLCTCLAKVDQHYQYEITVPPNFDRLADLTENLKLIKVVAVTFWEHFKVTQPDIYAALKAILGELTLEEVPNTPHAMRFSAALDNFRIAPFSFWKDNNDQLLAKQTNAIDESLPNNY